MADRIEHWDHSITSKLRDVQSKLVLASQLPPSSTSRSSLLSDAHKLLVRCRFAKTTYKSELNRLEEGSKERQKYEKRLSALEEEWIKAEEDIEALEAGATINIAYDVDPLSTTAHNSTAGCTSLPDAAIGAEKSTYEKMHWLFDPLLEFTTATCGCDPVSFADGTGGRYEHQASVVEEYFDTEENNSVLDGGTGTGTGGKPSRLPRFITEHNGTCSSSTGSGNGNGNGSNGDAKKKHSFSASVHDAVSSHSPFASHKSALEERGQRLEHLSDQTNKLESGAQNFADLAKQLKDKAKEEAGE